MEVSLPLSSGQNETTVSPQVLRAKFSLQELQELLSSCWVFERFLQGEAPLLHSLLGGVMTIPKRDKKNTPPCHNTDILQPHSMSMLNGERRAWNGDSLVEV